MRKNRSSKLLALPLLALTVMLALPLTEIRDLGSLLVAHAALAGNGPGETVTAIVQFSGEPLARVLPDHVKLAAIARARELRSAGALNKADPEAIAAEELATPHIARLDAEKMNFERNVARVAPDAVIHARFDTLLDGEAVTLPASELPLLSHLPGVKSVSPTQKFHPLLLTTVPLIDAPALWTELGGASKAGLDEKIAIVDTGIDQTHPFLTDSSLVSPPGFPRGDINFTSNKVIVARSYSPAGLSFTPQDIMGHGTHVSGIAAGVGGASPDTPLGGVAPKAFLMNYNVFGNLSDADTVDIARAVEDAINDGADVVNLSLGGPSVGLDADPLVVAIRNGIGAGVVFAIAAGNSGSGYNTILSPGITPEAITVGATTKEDAIAPFSSRGPNFDLSIKPDVVAPGASIYSSRPNGSYAYLSGTSMATPHVTGAVALLRQLHPTWTPAQVKSALMNSANFTKTQALSSTLAEDRGAGRIDLAAAADTGLTIDPPSCSFGVMGVGPNGSALSKLLTVTAQPGGNGAWSIAAIQTVSAPGISVSVSSPSLTVAPNSTATFSLRISATQNTPLSDYEGYVLLTKDEQSLHVPYRVRLVSYNFSTLLFPIYKNAVDPW